MVQGPAKDQGQGHGALFTPEVVEWWGQYLTEYEALLLAAQDGRAETREFTWNARTVPTSCLKVERQRLWRRT